MLHTLRNLVPAQLQKQAVMIKRTFIEVVDPQPDNRSSGSQRKRYFSDSAVLITPPPEVEAFSDAASTGEEDTREGRLVDPDFSDTETNPELQRERSASQEVGQKQETSAAEALSPHARADEGVHDSSRSVRFAEGCLERESDGGADAACNEGEIPADSEPPVDEDAPASPHDGDLSWRHLRTISLSEAATPAVGRRVAAAAELLPSPGAPSRAPAAEAQECGPGQEVSAAEALPPQARANAAGSESCRSVRFALELESGSGVDAACGEGEIPADSEHPDDEDTPANLNEEGELSWRHLRTISFSEAATPALGSRVAAVAELLPSHDAPSQPPAAQAAEAQQPAQALQPQPQFFAVLVPAVVGQCNAAAAPATGAAATATPPAPAFAQPPCQVADPAATAPQAVASPERRTTLMLRNVPLNYTRERLLTLLDRQGLSGLYDFAYLPIDFRTGASLGYAFVNAVDTSAAQRLWDSLNGFTRWSVPSKKKCSVSWNDPHQGFHMNVERYRNSPVMHHSVPDDFKPICFSGGVRTAYPPPTKAIKAPRLRK